MRWLMEFYNARQGFLVRYEREASSLSNAVALGWTAVLAEHRGRPRTGWLSLFERAERVGGQDASGWVLYRIVRTENGPVSSGGH
jgi:hypothetical protein